MIKIGVNKTFWGLFFKCTHPYIFCSWCSASSQITGFGPRMDIKLRIDISSSFMLIISSIIELAFAILVSIFDSCDLSFLFLVKSIPWILSEFTIFSLCLNIFAASSHSIPRSSLLEVFYKKGGTGVSFLNKVLGLRVAAL